MQNISVHSSENSYILRYKTSDIITLQKNAAFGESAYTMNVNFDNVSKMYVELGSIGMEELKDYVVDFAVDKRISAPIDTLDDAIETIRSFPQECFLPLFDWRDLGCFFSTETPLHFNVYCGDNLLFRVTERDAFYYTGSSDKKRFLNTDFERNFLRFKENLARVSLTTHEFLETFVRNIGRAHGLERTIVYKTPKSSLSPSNTSRGNRGRSPPRR